MVLNVAGISLMHIGRVRDVPGLLTGTPILGKAGRDDACIGEPTDPSDEKHAPIRPIEAWGAF